MSLPVLIITSSGVKCLALTEFCDLALSRFEAVSVVRHQHTGGKKGVETKDIQSSMALGNHLECSSHCGQLSDLRSGRHKSPGRVWYISFFRVHPVAMVLKNVS